MKTPMYILRLLIITEVMQPHSEIPHSESEELEAAFNSKSEEMHRYKKYKEPFRI